MGHFGHLEGEQPQLGDLPTMVIRPLAKWNDPPSISHRIKKFEPDLVVFPTCCAVWQVVSV